VTVVSTPRAADAPHAPSTVWLTGLPSAGKTTLARALVQALATRRVTAHLLDGDELRATTGTDLDFSRAGRREQARRVARRCAEISRAHVIPVVALVSPYRADRLEARALLTPGFVEVFVDAPLAVCQRRDVKGLYARARAGTLTGLTGLDDPYERPVDPEVHLHTDRQSIEGSLTLLLTSLEQAGDVPA
jgi:adenylylsulfate kinase